MKERDRAAQRPLWVFQVKSASSRITDFYWALECLFAEHSAFAECAVCISPDDSAWIRIKCSMLVLQLFNGDVQWWLILVWDSSVSNYNGCLSSSDHMGHKMQIAAVEWILLFCETPSFHWWGNIPAQGEGTQLVGAQRGTRMSLSF